MAGSFELYRDSYARNWGRMKIRPQHQQAVTEVAQKILDRKDRYEKVVDLVGGGGPPWWFYGLVHYRESNFRFDTFLGNGQPLNKVTTIVPKGEGPFYGANAFERGAARAMDIKGYLRATDWSLPRTLWRLESYNGFGYHGKGVNSPYLYGGSNIYGPPEEKPGKYVRDSVFDPKVVDTQLGTATILKRLTEMDPSITFGVREEVPLPQEDHPAPPIEAPPGAPTQPVEEPTPTPTPGVPVPPTPELPPKPKQEPDEALQHLTGWIQESLNTLGATPPLLVDGLMGPNTQKMLCIFQEENDLDQTGLPDLKTINEIIQHLRGVHKAPTTRVEPKVEGSIFDYIRNTFGGST